MSKTLLYRIFVVVLLQTIFSFNALCAKNSPGYYVATNGDTVKGSFPGHSQWTYNPEKVEFIPDKSSPDSHPVSIILTPDEVISFSIQDYDAYVSYKGPRMINTEEMKTNQALPVEADKFETINVFLREIGRTHEIEFYVYTDSLRSNFYYRNMNGMKELFYRKGFKENHVEDYKYQLKELLKNQVDSSLLGAELQHLEYNEESLVNFIDELNSITKENDNMPVKQFFVQLGLAFNSFSVTGTSTLSTVETNYNNSTSAVFGLSYLSTINRNFNRYFIYAQLKGYKFKNSGILESSTGVMTTTFKSDLVLLPTINFGYNIVNHTAIKIFIAPGAGTLFLINNRQLQENVLSGSYVNTETDESEVAFNLNAVAGTIILNRYMLWVNYNIPAAISNHQYYTGYLSTWQAGIAVRVY